MRRAMSRGGDRRGPFENKRARYGKSKKTQRETITKSGKRGPQKNGCNMAVRMLNRQRERECSSEWL